MKSHTLTHTGTQHDTDQFASIQFRWGARAISNWLFSAAFCLSKGRRLTLTNTVSFCLPFHIRSHEKRQGSGQSGHRLAQRCVLLGAGSPQFAVQHIQVQGDRGRGAATAVAARVPERLAAGRRAATVSSTQHAGARV